MQNDTEAISCEPLEKGDDSCVAGTDHFKDRPPSEGTSLTSANPNETKTSPLEDPWAGPELKDTETPWEELDTKRKVFRCAWTSLRVLLVFTCLYFFICSLDFLSSAFRLLGGKTAGRVFQDSELVRNPVCGVMIGLLSTVLVQSSSTTTSIVVSMVAADILTVKLSIPIIMGANIGTSVTNTLVSLGEITHRNDFRRAFAGATVHDMFNWLSVIVLLPLEVATDYLYHLTGAIIGHMRLETSKDANKDLLKAVTKPFTKLIIQIDSKKIGLIAKGGDEDYSLLKTCCLSKKTTTTNETGYNITQTNCLKKCSHLFVDSGLTDSVIGTIMLIVSLILLCVCLFGIVKLLNSLLQGHIRTAIKKFVNYNFPGKAAYFTGYVAILIGMGFTVLVQSSSVFTSALTPLVGIGVVSLDRMYSLSIGSNIGTTTTAILAALATDTRGGTRQLQNSLRIAMCHLFFNLSAMCLWYPIPFMRFPIRLSKFLGNTSARYRWFALFYLAVGFFLFPLAVFGLAQAGWKVLTAVETIFLFVVFTVGVIKFFQRRKPEWLPKWLRNWKFLPVYLRSLEPLDRLFKHMFGFCKMCHHHHYHNHNQHHVESAPTNATENENML